MRGEPQREVNSQIRRVVNDLTRASSNILEAVNIEIQQRFNELSSEIIAIH